MLFCLLAPTPVAIHVGLAVVLPSSGTSCEWRFAPVVIRTAGQSYQW